MRQLIRFEDAYGMADLICMTHDLGLIELIPKNNSLQGIKIVNKSRKENIYIECGVSFPAVISPSNELVASLKQYEIEELILVYDMDTPTGCGILSSQELEIRLKRLRQFLDNQNLNDVKIKLVPVVWAAETLLIYIMMHIVKDKEMLNFTEPIDLVHKLNIAKCHGKIIEEILKNLDISNCKSKHVRDYINKREIVVGLKDTLVRFPNSINSQIMKWLISFNDEILFDIDKAIDHQKKIEKFYDTHTPKQDKIFEIYGIKIDLNKKCW